MELNEAIGQYEQLNNLVINTNLQSNKGTSKEQLKILVKEVLNEIMEEQGTPYNG